MVQPCTTMAQVKCKLDTSNPAAGLRDCALTGREKAAIPSCVLERDLGRFLRAKGPAVNLGRSTRRGMSHSTSCSISCILGAASTPVLWLRDPGYGEAQSRPHDPPLVMGSQMDGATVSNPWIQDSDPSHSRLEVQV